MDGELPERLAEERHRLQSIGTKLTESMANQRPEDMLSPVMLTGQEFDLLINAIIANAGVTLELVREIRNAVAAAGLESARSDKRELSLLRSMVSIGSLTLTVHDRMRNP